MRCGSVLVALSLLAALQAFQTALLEAPSARLAVRSLRSQRSASLSMSLPVKPEKSSDFTYGLGSIAFSLLPLTPEAVGRRKTIFTEVVKDSVWTLDQVQGIINVNVPVRCTVIKLSTGLFVNNPVAPTPECVRMVRQLEALHGPVRYITLASLALEHKGTAGVFSTYFPQAKVYVQPGQYSFPLDLPTQLFFPLGRVGEIPESSKDAPWGEEIDHKILGVLRPPGPGGFAETAFFHKASRTLLVTDTVVEVRDEPPEVINEDPRALLYHARDSMLEVVEDGGEARRRGWRRMVLFGLTFQPSGIEVKDTFEALKMLGQVAPEMRALGDGAVPFDGGFYPWEWVRDDKPNFRALQGGLLVAPILQKLILNREPERVVAWVEEVCKWPFTRIIPAHLANDLKAGPGEFRAAFDFLYERPGTPRTPSTKTGTTTTTPTTSPSPSPSFLAPLEGLLALFSGGNKGTGKGGKGGGGKGARPLAEDVAFLTDVSAQLTKSGVLFPEAPLLRR